MVIKNKIDSNISSLAYAEEAILGVLPGEQGQAGTPVWNRLEPNSYSDFGGEVKTVAPTTINPSRQRRKGVTVDLDASGGFNHNLTYHNLTDLFQSIMFADLRKKGEQLPSGITATVYEIDATAGFLVGSLVFAQGMTVAANNGLKELTAVIANTSVAAAGLTIETPGARATLDVVGYQGAAGDIDVLAPGGSFPTLTSTLLDFTTLGLVVGQWIYIGGDTGSTGFVAAANNGFKRVRTIAADVLTFDKSDLDMVTEPSATETIRLFFGDVLRNEAGTLIVRRSYNLERTLGAPDTAQPAQVQSEILIGSVPNEVTLNIPSADLVNIDVGWVSIDSDTRTGAEGPKQTGVLAPVSAKEYNTSSDVGRLRLGLVSSISANVTPLFAYITEGSISINNNITPNKAVGVLGAFDVTAGTFAVSGNLTAYFATVAAVAAVRANEDVTLDISFVKNNTGMVFDFPLISLGDARLNVELDQPITLPLATDAASGEDVDALLDHTLLITYFNYLPNLAG